MTVQRSSTSKLKVTGKPVMKVTSPAAAKKSPASRSRRPPAAASGIPAKRRRAEEMVRDIRSRAESLLANADRLLSRLS